jgi:uncharacterized protein YecE (DUF72 family)
MRSGQLELFGAPEPAPAPALDFREEHALARRLPGHVRLGTSSWTFPGWAGLVYPGRPSERELVENGLGLYARHPLFRTVGIDRSYYAPLDRPTLARYAAQLPAGFRCVIKMWGEVTSAVHPRTREPNPRYLDAAALETDVLAPLGDAFREQAGPLVFEHAPLRPRELPRPRDFAARLDAFLVALPGGLEYAFELRNQELLCPEYLEVLRAHGVGHVLSYWERMPDLGVQLALPGILTAPFVVARLLIPPGERYEARRAALQPFDRLLDPQPKMREDVVRLVARAAAEGRSVWVIANNKAEGSSPLTVRALAERIVAYSS